MTGSGKTFTMANLIAAVGKPTLVIAHNKTLAAQLCNEFREFLPENAVEYFVSYYDYYQPEAYIAATDTYIEKDSSINDEIDRLRHSATSSLLTRDDVVIVASVSCIYGLGSPEQYLAQVVLLREGAEVDRDEVLQRLVAIQYERNDVGFARGKFRVRGDSFEIWPAYEDLAVRVSLWGDQVEEIVKVDPVTNRVVARLRSVAVYPATHFVTEQGIMERVLRDIEAELEQRLSELEAQANSWKRSASVSARDTTWRCCGKSATAAASRITHATSTAAGPASHHIPSLITSPKTSWYSSTNRT